MIVTNMPYSWALIRRIFKLKSFFGGSRTERMQGGEMEEVQGHSLGDINTVNQDRLRQQSQAGSEKRKRSLPWKKSSLKNTLSTNSEAPIKEGERGQDHIGDVEKEANINTGAASTSESSSGSARRPPTGRTTDNAVDKLYQLDFDDDELDRMEGPQRGYDG